jgi:Dolichyl-phosphate-mannose-protein mannosyltransferase
MIKNKLEISIVLAIVLSWIVCIALVNPLGNFPLNDDWAYGKPIKSFLEKGRFEFTSWSSMTLIGQLVFGIIVTKIFGFSFTVLRFFTLVCAVVSIVFSYLILRKVSGSIRLSLLFMLGIFFNPLFFNLSFTFMTDVPFYCFCCMAIFYNLEYFDVKNKVPLLLGTLFSVIAVLIRQPAVIVPFSFLCAVLFMREGGKKCVYYFLAQFIITLIVLLVYDKYLKYSLGYNREFTSMDMNFIKFIFSDPRSHALRFGLAFLKIPIYLGMFTMFLLPLIIPLYKNKRSFFIAFIGGLGLGIASLAVLESQGRRLPFGGGNILEDFGLGPVLLNPKGLFSLPSYFWQMLTIVSIICFAIIITAIGAYFYGEYKEKRKLSSITYLVPVVCIFSYSPIISVISFFDRYLILPFLLLSMVLVVVVKSNFRHLFSQKRFVISLILLVPGILFSVLGTKDYLSWNRARWEGLNYLTNEEHLSPYEIEGGFEFDAWYKFINPPDPYCKNAVLWVGDDIKCGVSFTPEANCMILKTIPYQRFLPLRREKIFVLERNSIAFLTKP